MIGRRTELANPASCPGGGGGGAPPRGRRGASASSARRAPATAASDTAQSPKSPSMTRAESTRARWGECPRTARASGGVAEFRSICEPPPPLRPLASKPQTPRPPKRPKKADGATRGASRRPFKRANAVRLRSGEPPRPALPPARGATTTARARARCTAGVVVGASWGSNRVRSQRARSPRSSPPSTPPAALACSSGQGRRRRRRPRGRAAAAARATVVVGRRRGEAARRGAALGHRDGADAPGVALRDEQPPLVPERGRRW